MPYQTFLPFTLSQLSALLAVAPNNQPINFAKDNNNNVTISTSVPASALPAYLTSGVLPEIVAAVGNIPINNSINFYKDANNVLNSSNIDNPLNSYNVGYAYQFIDGSFAYTAIPITSILNIPWLFPSSTLTSVSSNLFNNTCNLWIDSQETKAINVQRQQIISKDYNSNVLIIDNPNDINNFIINNSIDMSNSSAIQTNTTFPVTAYFKLCFVLTIPNISILETIILHYDLLKIKLTSRVPPNNIASSGGSGVAMVMIGLFLNDVYQYGITLNQAATPSTYKYIIYIDSSGNFNINNNNAIQGSPATFNSSNNVKMYINQDATGTNNANIKLHELLFYQSTANNINATLANLQTYYNNRWSITNYADSFNVPLVSHNFLAYSQPNYTPQINSWSSNRSFTYYSQNCWVNSILYGFQGLFQAGIVSTSDYMLYTLNSSVNVTGIKFIYAVQGSYNQAIFNFQGSNDNATWSTVYPNFTFFNLAQSANYSTTQDPDFGFAYNTYSNLGPMGQTVKFNNVTPYTYYRFIGVSGNYESISRFSTLFFAFN